MQRNISKILLFVFLPVVLVSSCKKDFLDRQPYAGLPTAEAITTVDDLEAALHGVYATLRSPNLYGRTIPLFGDLFADNVYISTTNSNRYLEFFQVNFTVNNANAAGIWQTAYNAILNANNVINSSLAATPEIDQIKGEAHALRALMYFELVKHFATPYTANPNAPGVPIVLSYNPFLKPTRNTVTQVYTQINNDLQAAMDLITFERSSGFLSFYAARALQARMFQFMGSWANALSAAEDVINNSGYFLLPYSQVQPYWSANTLRTDGMETLFEVSFDLVGNAGNDALAYFYDQVGYGDALAAQSLYNLYQATDVRRTLFLNSSPVRGNVRV